MMETDRPTAAREETFLLQALSHPNRLTILRLLATHSPDMSVEELTAHLCIKQPTTSFHLRLLRHAGLVEMRKQGLHSLYCVRPERLRQAIAVIEEIIVDEEVRRA
jgi:DNA-binding transcriptional ArsR family regulator